MKDIAVEIMECAMNTGYDFDFLCDLVETAVNDGEDYKTAVNEVIEIAYEYDF